MYLKKAMQIIQKAADRNGKKLTEKSLGSNVEMTEKSSNEKASEVETMDFKELFNRHLLKNTLVMFIAWPIVTLGYYGITFGMANLTESLFLNFALGSLIEIPSYIAVLALMDIIGRKPIFSGSLLLTGASCVVVGYLAGEEGVDGVKTVLAMSGKFFASGTFAIVYMYTAELYPTLIRSTAVGSCSLMARIGGMLAPQITLYLPNVTNDSVPYYLMGSCSLVGGLLALLLPETLGSSLPDTMEDVDKIKKNGKSFWKCMNPCSKK